MKEYPKLTARANDACIGILVLSTSQGQTLNGMVCEKEFSNEKYTRAMEQREAATGLSKAREAADR